VTHGSEGGIDYCLMGFFKDVYSTLGMQVKQVPFSWSLETLAILE
jgi:hypothetical protein